MAISRSEGIVCAVRRMIRAAALRRGIFIGRATAPGAPESGDAHLSFLLSKLGVNCVLDVGAHTGEFARRLRELGYSGRIVSFEPVGGHFEALQRAMGSDAHWKGMRLALGSTDGHAIIHITGSSTFTSFLPPSRYGEQQFSKDLRTVREERVEVRRLDGVWDACVADIAAPVVFLKIDTQGLDHEVIRGAGTRIERVSGIQTEIAVKPIYEGMTTGLAESIGRLQALGFEVTALMPVARDPVDHLRLIEMDCVVVRPAHLARSASPPVDLSRAVSEISQEAIQSTSSLSGPAGPRPALS